VEGPRLTTRRYPKAEARRFCRAPIVTGLAILTLLSAATQPARANSDPASDVLLSQQLFLPVSTTISPTLSAKLTNTVSDANRRGYEIRVAIIATRADLGGLPSLWEKPKTYARFLSEELRSAYTGRLLVAMPNGFGFFAPSGASGSDQHIIAGLTVASGPDGFIRSTIDAITRLEAAASTSAPHSSGAADSGSQLPLALIAGIVAAALTAGAAGALLWRHRRTTRRGADR